MESSTSSTTTPTAETATAEVMGRLSAIAPGTEISLALEALHEGEPIPIQLIDVGRGYSLTSAAQYPL